MISIIANCAGIICIGVGAIFSFGGGWDCGIDEATNKDKELAKRGVDAFMIACWFFFAAVVLMAFVAQPYVREVCSDIVVSIIRKVTS